VVKIKTKLPERMLSEKMKAAKGEKFVEIPQKELEAFIKNHTGIVNQATTLTSTLNGKTIKLLNSKGELIAKKGQSVTMSVRDGKVIEAFVGSRKLKAEELKALQTDFSKEIAQFGKQSGNTYGLTNFEYVYRQKGGQKVRFDARRNITAINSIQDKSIVNADDIKKYLEANSGIKAELEGITAGSALPDGYRLGNIIVKSDSGNIFTICDGKVQAITLPNGKVYKIHTRDFIDSMNTAEIKNEVEKILQSFKS
jgi:hypothetical protein